MSETSKHNGYIGLLEITNRKAECKTHFSPSKYESLFLIIHTRKITVLRKRPQPWRHLCTPALVPSLPASQRHDSLNIFVNYGNFLQPVVKRIWLLDTSARRCLNDCFVDWLAGWPVSWQLASSSPSHHWENSRSSSSNTHWHFYRRKDLNLQPSNTLPWLHPTCSSCWKGKTTRKSQRMVARIYVFWQQTPLYKLETSKQITSRYFN